MASDMFLKIDGIPGESTDDKHGQWIDMLSMSQGVTQTAGVDRSAVGGHTGGRVDVSELSFMKLMDASSMLLTDACNTGKHIPTCEIELCTASGEKHTFMKYKLTDVLVSSVQTSHSSGGDSRPTESISLNFGKIEWEYIPFDNTGKAGKSVRAVWDLAKNKNA